MFVRTLSLGLLGGSLLSAAVGCGAKPVADKAEAPPISAKSSGAATAEAVARVHWIGTKRLVADTNAAYLKTILDLPESARLKKQTLDKLALWLAHATPSNYANPPTNYAPLVASSPAAKLFRPLLVDLVAEESYFEMRRPKKGAAEFVVAVRLESPGAAAWQTNLAAALKALTGTATVPGTGGSWAFSSTNHPGHGSATSTPLSVSLTRAGAWTVVAVSHGASAASFGSELAARIQSHPAGNPFGDLLGTKAANNTTNYWLELNLDLLSLSDLCPPLSTIRAQFAPNSSLSTNLPSAVIGVFGDGADVHVTGDMRFPHPLPLDLDQWSIPTNLVQDPLISFTAMRGLRPLLNGLKPWQQLQLPTSPNQLYIWALRGVPIQDFAAAPWPDARLTVRKIGEKLIQQANPALASRGFGGFEYTNVNEVTWRGAPFIAPDLRALTNGLNQLFFASLVPPPNTELAPPPELMDQVTTRTNLIYYDWELTGPRLEQWLYLSQLARLLAAKSQMSPTSASLEWLKAAGPNLGNSITVLRAIERGGFGVSRRSSLGVTAVELQLLADWLESPGFPRGLHTTLVSPRTTEAPPLR